MKFDKETVKKHQFWFMLAVAMPLALVAIFVLLTMVSAEISNRRKDLEKKYNESKGAGQARNQLWIDQMQKKAGEAEALKDKVWQGAYDAQKDLYTWTEELERQFQFSEGLFATEINGERGKAAPVSPPVPPPGGEPEPGQPRQVIKHFKGAVKEVKKDWIRVADGNKTPKKFYRTVKMKVQINGKPEFFVDLQKEDVVDVTYVQGKYFHDPLTDSERELFAQSYGSQINGILSQVNPVNDKGEGVVILRDWAYKEDELPPANAPFLRFVAGEWNRELDISSEAWMAQEDLWVQREVYRLVRLANDYVSKFRRTTGKENSNAGTFVSPYWKLELAVTGPKKLTAKITNLLQQRQKLDIYFLVQLRKEGEPDKIFIPGEPLDPQEQSKEKTIELEGLAPTGIYSVEQAINWETAAVRRIDHISLGSLAAGDCCHSHRTFPEGLKAFKEEKKDGGGAPPPPQAGGPQGPEKGGGPGGRGATADQKTPNGLEIKRYSNVTTQARRLPIGVALIIDQDHVDRVLTAFANSNLRFLTTQVIINRYPYPVRPNTAAQGAGGNPGLPLQFPMGLKGPGPKLPGGVGPRQQQPTGGGEEQATNVELVIYGIVSLYERYPPRITSNQPNTMR